MAAMAEPLKIYMIGTTHFDPVWMWTWDEAMASIRSTFRSALKRMEETPGFIYSFCDPAVFQWIEEVDPDLFNEIQRKVEEGRWELVHGWWVQPDCHMAAGESYVRHGLYAQRYLEEKFGRRANTAFNTDSFGHNVMLPQILKKSGIDHYVFGRPSRQQQDLPDNLFNWRSPDGSSVVAFLAGGEGANAYSQDVEEDLREMGGNLPEIGHDCLMLYGVSNHGGAPTKQAIADVLKVKEDEGSEFAVDFGTVQEFMERQECGELPELRDELMVRDFGVFINENEVKKNNRRCEYALMNAEKLAVVANVLGGREYPADRLRSLWQDALFNQFHDILWGASVKPAYFDARNKHGRVLQSADEILHYSLQAVTRDIDTSGEGFPVVVWNPNTFPVDAAVEAELQWAWEFEWYEGPIRLTDHDGENIPVQIIQERSVLPGFRSRFLFRDTIPALGYRVYYVHREKAPVVESPHLHISKSGIENDRLRVKINRETGGIASVYDKGAGEEIMSESARFVIREDEGDTWAFSIDEFGEPMRDVTLTETTIVEDGPLRVILRTKAECEDSYFERDYILYKDSNVIEGRYRVDWRDTNKVLKLAFDTGLNDPRITSSVPYGALERDGEGREYPTGEWLDISTGERGVSIISDSIFAYDADGSVASLSILRSPVYAHFPRGEAVKEERDYEYMGQGRHEGAWKLVPHDGDWRDENIPERATAFNNPVITVDEANHPGERPPEDSFMEIRSDTALGTVLKRAENGEDLIVRFYEYGGNTTGVDLNMSVIGEKYVCECQPHQIKTVRLNRAGGYKIKDVDNLE